MRKKNCYSNLLIQQWHGFVSIWYLVPSSKVKTGPNLAEQSSPLLTGGIHFRILVWTPLQSVQLVHEPNLDHLDQQPSVEIKSRIMFSLSKRLLQCKPLNMNTLGQFIFDDTNHIITIISESFSLYSLVNEKLAIWDEKAT